MIICGCEVILSHDVFIVSPAGNIMEKEFSDANCNVMTNSTTHKVSSCLFDYNEFNNDIEYLDEGDDYASAFIEYTSLECGMPLV